MGNYDDLGESHPQDDAPVDRSMFRSWSDEYTPLDAMSDLLPEEVKALGSRADRPGSGDWVSFGINQENNVVTTLISLGYVVTRDDILARQTGGEWIADNFTGP